MAAVPLKHGKLETALIGRGLEGFQRRVEVELQPSGTAELDAVLGGGFPRGSQVELCGRASSGRTRLVFSLLAQATERQEACAFVEFRILSTQFLWRLPEWNYLDCYGSDVEKWGIKECALKRANLMRRYPVSRKLNNSKIDDAEGASPITIDTPTQAKLF